MASFDDFKQSIERFGFVGGLVATGSILAPLVTAANGFAPPLFDGLNYLTTLFMLVALIICFSLVQGMSKARFRRLIMISGFSFMLISFSYLYVLDRFVHPDPTRGGKPIIVGCGLTPEIRQYGSDYLTDKSPDCPGEASAVNELLRDGGGEPEKVWTSDSLRWVALGLLALWMAMFTALTVLVTGFVGSLKDKRAKSG